MFSIETTNTYLEIVVDSASGIVGDFTAGCPVDVSGLAEGILTTPSDKIVTIAGMERVDC